MRLGRVSLLFVVVLLVLGGITWLIAQWPSRQTLTLPDGSQVTLLKVTQGTNHVCRYGNRWQDWLHPVLPRKLRTKFPRREMTFTSGLGETTVVWLRHDGATAPSWSSAFFLAAADENGLESALLQSANVTRTLTARPALVGPGQGPVQWTGGSAQISGWELKSFPRRAGRFALCVYQRGAAGDVVRLGEFHVRAPCAASLPSRTADAFPVTRQTNGLEISLTKLETGLTGKETGHGPAGEGAKSFSRATFIIRENNVPTDKWSLCGIRASNAAGETRAAGSYGSRWERGEHQVDFEGALWLEEAAWKLEAEFARTGGFPADELWPVGGVSVPKSGELLEARVLTNLHHTELEFLGVSGPEAKLPEDYAGIRPHANLHVRTPHPMDGLRLVLVEVRDDQGRKLALRGSTSRSSMGGRGNTPKEMLHGFAIEIPEDTRSLDLTFAATRVRSVEFLARPVMFEAKPETRNPQNR